MRKMKPVDSFYFVLNLRISPFSQLLVRESLKDAHYKSSFSYHFKSLDTGFGHLIVHTCIDIILMSRKTSFYEVDSVRADDVSPAFQGLKGQ